MKEEGRRSRVTDVVTEAEVTVIQLLDLKMENGTENQGMQPDSRSWKKQGKDGSLEPPEEYSLANTLTVAQ